MLKFNIKEAISYLELERNRIDQAITALMPLAAPAGTRPVKLHRSLAAALPTNGNGNRPHRRRRAERLSPDARVEQVKTFLAEKPQTARRLAKRVGLRTTSSIYTVMKLAEERGLARKSGDGWVKA